MLLLHMQEIVFVDFSGGPFVLSREGGGQTYWHQAYNIKVLFQPNICYFLGKFFYQIIIFRFRAFEKMVHHSDVLIHWQSLVIY